MVDMLALSLQSDAPPIMLYRCSGENRETSGMAPSADVHGEHSELAAPQSVQEKRQEREKPSENERKMGESDSKRSLGEAQVRARRLVPPGECSELNNKGITRPVLPDLLFEFGW